MRVLVCTVIRKVNFNPASRNAYLSSDPWRSMRALVRVIGAILVSGCSQGSIPLLLAENQGNSYRGWSLGNEKGPREREVRR
jgi:hypothetical protein